MPNVSESLAAFICENQWGDIPTDVQHNARRSLLNGLATTFAGCQDVALEAIIKTMMPFSGPPQATVIGRSEKADAMTAAFINAAAMNVHDFDDTHLNTVIHPTAPVAPALLAFAERQRVSGRNLLHALVLGIEVACRVGNAVSPGHYRRGWHITASCGIFGAAAAIGKILDLDQRQMIHALGAASAQASGLVETLGFMAKSIGVGAACRGGLLAAMLAENGLDGPDQPLEGPRGFLQVTGDDPQYDEITSDLGSRWETLKNIHKPYPGGVVLFPVIDACLEFHRSDRNAARVKSVILYGHPLLAQRTDRPDVETGREAQVSAQHVVGVCLTQGAAGLDQFSDAAVKDPDARAFRDKVRIIDDTARAVTGVRVVFEMTDGSSQEIVIDHGRGTDECPLTDQEIEEKFRTLASWGAPDCGNAENLIDAVWALDANEDAGAIMGFAQPS